MKDAIGNELRVGDLVILNLDRPQLFGRVIEVREGGLVSGIQKNGNVQVRPSILLVAANHTVECDPRQRLGSVVALRDPEAEAQREEPPAAAEGLAN